VKEATLVDADNGFLAMSLTVLAIQAAVWPVYFA
jgi:hypothetical protein